MILKKGFITMIFIFAFALCVFAQKNDSLNYKPAEGFVPTSDVAIKIAVAVWIPIYGDKQIKSEKPYKATLSNGIWTVTGSLPESFQKGGTAEAVISKETGCILKIIHGK